MEIKNGVSKIVLAIQKQIKWHKSSFQKFLKEHILTLKLIHKKTLQNVQSKVKKYEYVSRITKRKFI